MMPSVPVRRQRRAPAVLRPQLVTLALAMIAGGCSADVTRFDFPAFNLNGDPGATAAIPRPPEPVRSGGSEYASPPPVETDGRWRGGAYAPPPSDSRNDVRMSALPDNTPTTPQHRAEPASAPQRSVLEEPIARGDEIVVEQGDTLYGLSRRYGVGLSELMTVNGLAGPAIKPGQRLHLPAGTRGNGSPGYVAQPRPEPVAEQRTTAAVVATDWTGTHTVAPGESLYRLSRQYNVKSAELQRVNGITDPRRIRPGTVLKVPGAGDGSSSSHVAAAPRYTAPPRSAPEAPARIQSTTQPTLLNGSEQRVAALPGAGVVDAPVAPAAEQPAHKPKPVQVVSVTPADSAGSKLRWPVSGKIISGFGQRNDGTHNDGINLAVPLGTEVHAAEDGVVAYAGSELKGYGNLVLVRHDNGWVTAYAHNDEMLVKRGDKVTRGQVIAKAGKSGQVDQPQVHFELRQGAKPVDPIPFLAKG